MKNTVKRLIAFFLIFLMSFSVIAYVGGNNFTVSAAAETVSIKTKPTLKSSSIKATSVKLTWSKTRGATQYRVYKSTDKKTWTLVTKTKKTSCTVKNLTGNKTYYFRVKAYKTADSKTTKSPYSKTLTVKTKKNETVYATKKLTVRAKASSKSEKLGTLKADKSIKRTASTSKGWSKVIYKGKSAYISSEYLTIKKPANAEKEQIPLLVNSKNKIPKDYKVELVTLKNGKKVAKEIKPSLQKMFDDMRKEGYNPQVTSGYRTTEYQKDLFNRKYNANLRAGYSKQTALALTKKWIAEPGSSEHETGLAVDINYNSGKDSDAVHAWLLKNAHKYGFIKRYSKDKTEITGIADEPWHYRYVGIEAATVMKNENLCLEEYIEYIS